MKKVDISKVLTTEIKSQTGESAKIPVAELINAVLTNPPEGVKFSEMAVLVDLIRKVNTAQRKIEGFILLENLEHATLVNQLKNFRYAKPEPIVYDWILEIEKLPDEQVTVCQPTTTQQ